MIALAEPWREGFGKLVPNGAERLFAKKKDGSILDEVHPLVVNRVFAMLQTKRLFPVKINFVPDVLLYCYPVILKENSSLFDSLVHMGNSEATIDYVAQSAGYGQRQADEHILEQGERDKEKEENNEEKKPQWLTMQCFQMWSCFMPRCSWDVSTLKRMHSTILALSARNTDW
ncbi:uncharacterized protein MONOS_10458 [Monocercomonoides exilis]|uniref:uncharacterized protein n=1 Tax=Monocercomonoides exilis TaxID=2049356 RepID=UPI003559866B|nr:hypothetical protein MONOS_10458 [Monocercomonoides exilis]|eukprot:MONOS_10458.1-p1 / transcript=MONOS_10458.1 / gene=MONOS_10458 / organism=Monocercomonoides_exilis_PA203 / gene_product=unspecified product / transcript_product=unspecified product / location=Mono_scaffold00477:1941-2459(-) / protein_length=173 / sequence_SO=supercontig / SO=protein_coding / is_pseudo=false